MAKTVSSLVPSIEQREAAWTRVQERLARVHKAAPHPSVTLSREYGCEGFPLAQHLKERLETASGQPWTIYDQVLVERVAADEHLSRNLLAHLGDESHGQDVLRAQFGLPTHNDAYAKLASHMRPIAAAGGAIIVGRGGAIVCQDLANCFHFRLVGSLEFRVATLARRLDMPLKEAEDLVRSQSELREQFISDCLGVDITSPRWYDAVFDNGRRSVESIAQACHLLVESGWKERNNGLDPLQLIHPHP